MQDDTTAKPKDEQSQPTTSGGLITDHEKEREKDNRAEAFRSLKRAGRGRRR